MKNKPINKSDTRPWLVIDTGTLLTMLLGTEDIPTDTTDLGYLPIILDLARSGKVRIAIPDMVVSEFFDSQTPISRDELNESVKRYNECATTQQKIQVGAAITHQHFSKPAERVEFFSKLATINQEIPDTFYMIETPASEHYLAYAEAQKQEAGFGDKKLADLYRKNTKLYNAARTNGWRKDMGEIAIADTIHHLQVGQGNDNPPKIFVLYEGNDVRSRVLQRYHHPEDLQRGKAPRAFFNPNMNSFNKFKANEDLDGKVEDVLAIGDVSFVTTASFFETMMQKAKEYGHFITKSDETDNIGDAYQSVINSVIANGLSRHYKTVRDFHVTDLSKNDNDKNHDKSAPFKAFIEGLDTQVIKPITERAMLSCKLNHILMAQYHLNAATEQLARVTDLANGMPAATILTVCSQLEGVAQKARREHENQP
jgi:hypothetical protein